MNIPFTISEFCVTEYSVPQEIADKIIKHHIQPMVKIREMLHAPIWASQKSGYRPKSYEIQRGRSGNSQHCFEDKGAVDWTTKGNLILDLLDLLKQHSPYTRICYYPNDGFIHVDYASDTRQFFTCDSPTSKWKFVKNL